MTPCTIIYVRFMFLSIVQHLFDFASKDIAVWRQQLVGIFGDSLPVRRRPPLGQLLKSIISSRTRDAVSTAAYDTLIARFPTGAAIAAAPPGDIERVIQTVTFAPDKAAYLVGAMIAVGRQRPDYCLDFLAVPPLDDALAWLERLPGVGRKVAASTLNASTLARPVFIVDTHVLRVLQRLGFVGPTADYAATSAAVTAAMPGWVGDDFLLLHILMKKLGQTLCRWDEPCCRRCPLSAGCPTARRGARTGGASD